MPYATQEFVPASFYWEIMQLLDFPAASQPHLAMTRVAARQKARFWIPSVL